MITELRIVVGQLLVCASQSIKSAQAQAEQDELRAQIEQLNARLESSNDSNEDSNRHIQQLQMENQRKWRIYKRILMSCLLISHFPFEAVEYAPPVEDPRVEWDSLNKHRDALWGKWRKRVPLAVQIPVYTT